MLEAGAASTMWCVAACVDVCFTNVKLVPMNINVEQDSALD